MSVATVRMPVGSPSPFCPGADVAEKKDKKKIGRPLADEPTVSVSARIPQHVYDALMEIVEEARPKVTGSAVICDALEIYLRQKGKLPRKSAQ